jgi:hypothetical protein
MGGSYSCSGPIQSNGSGIYPPVDKGRIGASLICASAGPARARRCAPHLLQIDPFAAACPQFPKRRWSHCTRGYRLEAEQPSCRRSASAIRQTSITGGIDYASGWYEPNAIFYVLVGVAGFEPATPSSRTRCSTTWVICNRSEGAKHPTCRPRQHHGPGRPRDVDTYHPNSDSAAARASLSLPRGNRWP